MKNKESCKKIEQNIFIIQQMSFKEAKKKTTETNLGVFWNILNPLIYMIILSSYYQNIVRHDEIEKFPVFVFIGLTIFNFYNVGTRNTMRCFVDNKNFLLKAKMNPKIFLSQKIWISLKELMYSSVAMVPILLFYKQSVTLKGVLIIPIIMLTTLVVYGIGEILAITFIFFADIEYLYSVLMTLLIFVSSTFIPISHFPKDLERILSYNPIFLSINMVRDCILYNRYSHWSCWVKLSLWAFVSVCIGNILYEKCRNKIINKL